MPLYAQASLLAVVSIAAIFDFRTRRIPNWLNVGGVVLGLISNFAFSGMHGLQLSALGMLLALLIYLPLYAIRGMGAGDVKLMAAVGAIAGPENWLYIFVVTALLGGLVSLVLVFWKKRLRHTLANVLTLVGELAHGRIPGKTEPELDVHDARALRLPHGCVIALGCAAFLVANTGR
jgi:prepilin peptidase CpaA